MQHIFVVGLSYKTAPIAIREQFAVSAHDQAAVMVRLRERIGLSEVVLLWTCNRVEIYGVLEDASPDPIRCMSCIVDKPLQGGAELYIYQGADAVRHLLSVASGLDSMVLGETEITGQVKNAYEKARVIGHTGRRLNRLFQKALETAKEIRSGTAIGKGAASVGSVAIQHAQKVFGASLEGRRVMVIGAGDMAEKCLRHLVKRGAASIVVVNRSLDKAEVLAAEFGGRAVPYGGCLEAMTDVDMVITSTGCPHIILERRDLELVMARRKDRPLLIVDIAVPRDVAPEVRDIPGVHLQDIGDLEGTVRENIRYREQDMHLCRSMVAAKVEEFAERMRAAAEVQMAGATG